MYSLLAYLFHKNLFTCTKIVVFLSNELLPCLIEGYNQQQSVGLVLSAKKRCNLYSLFSLLVICIFDLLYHWQCIRRLCNCIISDIDSKIEILLYSFNQGSTCSFYPCRNSCLESLNDQPSSGLKAEVVQCSSDVAYFL